MKFSTLVGVLALPATGVPVSELRAEDRVPVLLELNAALTDRQGEYGNTLNLDGAYTPQPIVDGRFELDPNRPFASVRLTKGDCLCATD